MKFLSREEQECLQFFEKTIDSLEESLEENEQQPGEVKATVSRWRAEEVDGPLSSSPSPGVLLSNFQARHHSSKDHDIIDLVHPEPDLVQNRGPILDPTGPGNIFFF